jgi:hypothetical protein
MPRWTNRLTRLTAAAWLSAACGGADLRGRAVQLTSADVRVDRALVRAREKAADGDYAAAERLLMQVIETHPRDPLAAVARVEAARLLVARDALAAASALLGDVPAAADPALAMRRSLVTGLVHARRGEVEAGLAALRPLARRLIDRANSVEADCALAALEALAERPAEALLALARVESQAEGGVRWTPTGLACDVAATRAAEVTALLARVNEPRSLADALDALPADHPARVEVARRLRALAEARNEIPQWLRWLADLPDTEATLRVVRDAQGPPALRVGVLAPTAGPRAVAGTEVLRAVQLALEDQRAVELLVDDEGDAPGEPEAGFDRLAARHLTALIGPAFEDHAAAVSARAAAAGVDVYLLSPHLDDASPLGPHVMLAGPPPAMRAATLAAAARTRGTRVRWAAAPGVERAVFPSRVRSMLALAGVTAVEGAGLASPELHVVLGPWGFEARTQIEALAARAPLRWIFDARSGPAGAPGVWVGVVASEAPAAAAALSAFRARYCELTGRPPGELALLAHDAARRIVARARGGEAVGVLAQPWRVGAVTTTTGDGALAATWRCPAP